MGPDVFATDPVPFYNKLISDPKVIAMIPFIWFNVGAYTGIHYDGRAPDYCRVGAAIKNGMKAKRGVVLLDPCSAFGGGATTQ